VGKRIYPAVLDVTRQAQPFALIFQAEAGKTLELGDIRATAPTTLTLSVSDAETSESLPCKVQVTQVSGPEVDFGPPYASQGFRNYYCLPTGKGTLPIPYHGSYEVRVTRGPEYSLAKFPVIPNPGKDTKQAVQLKHLVDTTGYIAVDPGVQTINSPGCRVQPKDLVQAAAAEGVEWLVSADVNQATDLKPAIREAGLQNFLGATTGIRPVPAKKHMKASFTAFPVSKESAQALPMDAAPTDLLAAMRKQFPKSLLMVNTPLSQSEGYLRRFDPNTIRKNDPSFNYDFDLYEFLDGRMFQFRDLTQQYFDRLSQGGHRYSPVAASSSSELFGNEPGWPRTFVGVPDDDPAHVTEEQIVQGMKKGDVVVSNGPFIRFTVEGKRPGELVEAKGKKTLDANIEVWAAPWMQLSTIFVWKDNQFHLSFSRGPTVDETLRFPLKSASEQNPVKIQVLDDVTLQVLAFSDNYGPMADIAEMEGRRQSEFPVFAITGMIYVDADGDGKCSPPPGGVPRF